MPSIVAPVTISATGSQTVYVGSQGTVGAVVIANESPYGIVASAGAGGQWIPAQMADRMNCDTLAFSGSITLTTNDYLSNAAQAPSYIVLITVYAPGEAIPGIYPCALARMSNIGNSSVVNTPANVFEQDLFTPFVYEGYTCAKDGSVANQLDVAAGVAFVRQSSDNSLLRIANTSTTFDTTTPSATYFLDLNPDATWNWGTTHSGVTNHLTVCSVTTDGSGNISAVTDARVTLTTLLTDMVGGVQIGGYLQVAGMPNGKGTAPQIGYYGANNATQYWTPQSGSVQWHEFVVWNGTATKVPLGLGSAASGNAQAWVGDNGNLGAIGGQATAGSFGAPVIVAQTVRQHVTTVGGNVTVLSFTPSATGLYRVNGYVVMQDTAARALGFIAQWTDPDSNFAGSQWLTGVGGVGGTTVQAFNNSNLWNNGIGFGAASTPFVAKAGAGINVVYQHDTGTANDYVTAVIERLA